MTIKKIVVIGPESTGKSILCSSLAQHYNTEWCPEYAREYLEANGMDYTYDDLLVIAKGQLKKEEEFVEKTMGNGQWAMGNKNKVQGTRNKEQATSNQQLSNGTPAILYYSLIPTCM